MHGHASRTQQRARKRLSPDPRRRLSQGKLDDGGPLDEDQLKRLLAKLLHPARAAHNRYDTSSSDSSDSEGTKAGEGGWRRSPAWGRRNAHSAAPAWQPTLQPQQTWPPPQQQLQQKWTPQPHQTWQPPPQQQSWQQPWQAPAPHAALPTSSVLQAAHGTAGWQLLPAPAAPVRPVALNAADIMRLYDLHTCALVDALGAQLAARPAAPAVVQFDAQPNLLPPPGPAPMDNRQQVASLLKQLADLLERC